jgi:hypothetical protein
VTNLGPFQASAVTLVDAVPDQTTFVSLDPGGASCTAPAAGATGAVICNFGNMASGAAATVTMTVQTLTKLPNKDTITNTAVVSSPNFDPNPANNSASVTTLIVGHKPR